MDIRADSVEYATATLTTDHDITGDTIEVALPAAGSEPATWTEATVTGVADNGDGTFTATYRLLLGTGALDLAAGTYSWIVRLTDSPEIPTRHAGVVRVS